MPAQVDVSSGAFDNPAVKEKWQLYSLANVSQSEAWRGFHSKELISCLGLGGASSELQLLK
jgi:hypothetical protein